MIPNTTHNFHIPVMGIGFTIDSPIKVARFGINTALSIVEDDLIEQMRKFYSNLEKQYHELFNGMSEELNKLEEALNQFTINPNLIKI